MRYIIILLVLHFSLASFSQLNNRTIHDLKTGRIKDDTSFVYRLPYKTGSKYLFVQGANSKFSHKGELSFDFKMKQGSKICAAREGIVIAVKMDSDKGGLNDEYMNDGNHIVVRHADGSMGQYWHLQLNGVYVKVGDTVSKGQLIGSSGNTGYTAFPHLHFQVIDQDGKEILPRFYTKKGSIYLRPGRWYKAVS